MEFLILIAVMVVLATLVVIYASRKDKRVEAVMGPVASALGARYENQIIRGEREGVKFQIALLGDVALMVRLPENEFRKSLSRERFVVRAKVPGLLPLGLVAIPSKWISQPHRMETSTGLSGDPELERSYLVLTNDPEKSRRLLEDAEVRQALKALMQRPTGAGLLFDDCVYIAYETDTYPKALESPEEAQRCVDTVVQAALVLDRVYSRIKEELDAAGAA